ncbi:transcriptional regulator [Streptomyces sp. NPDC093094]|uniref:transcriptional regulator n=1 Tax=Streptomyces sp. NPDC093094 TaxID=3366026 RepID=UPI0037FE4617
MTVTETTPPPRLPVRETAARREMRGLSPMLGRLSEERATGVLEREHGSLYLADGQVVHAESPFAAGLDVLLPARGTLAAETWREAVALADARHGAARILLDSGRVPRGALELCHTDALFDAAYFALAPSRTPGRFRHDDPHWLGPLRPVGVAALERETLRRRSLLHRLWPDARPDSAPLVRTDSGAGPGCPVRQRAVLDLVDGVRTAPDIARELGRHTFHTLVDVRRLTAAGLVAAGAPPPPPEPPPGPALPRVTDPDITLLKRLRDALEAL